MGIDGISWLIENDALMRPRLGRDSVTTRTWITKRTGPGSISLSWSGAKLLGWALMLSVHLERGLSVWQMNDDH